MSLRFFKNNELIYTKDIGRNFNLQEAMNLSKLDKGNYEAVLSAGGNEYSYPIVIQ
jgi:hypothetical protein